MEIRESAEDYLERILMLNKSMGQVRAVDIANLMNFSKPSVSIALKKLRQNGYVNIDGGGYITLTESGLEIAERVFERHRLISQLLMALGVDEQTAKEDACRVEHDDLTEEWDKVTEDGSKLTMGALVVRKDFAESNPEAVEAFLKEYQASTEYVTDEANLDDAAALIEKYGIIAANVAKQALPYCNIVCITGEEMKTAAEGFLSILAEANPSSVGGALPAEDFYYLGA